MEYRADVVWFTSGQSKNNDWELRYSLRSVAANLLDIGSVYLIGPKPDFVQKVFHIPFDDEPTANKDRNLIQKLVYLSGERQLTEAFVIMSDDHFLMQPICHYNMLPYVECVDSCYTRDRLWQRRFLRTQSLMKRLGKSQHNFDTHVPHVVEKQKCRELLKYNFDGTGLTCFSYYFNLHGAEPAAITPEIRLDARRNGWTQRGDEDYAVCNDSTLKDNRFKDMIESRFKIKSIYEK